MISERQGDPEGAKPSTGGNTGRDTWGASRLATGTYREGTCAEVSQIASDG